MLRRLAQGLATTLLVALGSVASADTLTVPTEYPTIQSAIDAAASGDEVLVDAGVYYENLDFNGKGLTLRSVAGAIDTVIDAGGSGYGIYVSLADANVFISGFTVRNAATGIYIHSTEGEIHDCIVTQNSGRGITLTYAARIKTYDSVISENAGGGVYVGNGSGSFYGCDISNNSASSGAAVMSSTYASARFYDCNISGNSATYNGGVLWLGIASASFNRCHITDNTAGQRGGAFYNSYQSSANVADSVVTGNSAPLGGASYIYRGGMRFTNVTMVGNVADQGASFYLQDSYGSPWHYATNSIIRDNSSPAFLGTLGNGQSTATYSNIEGGHAGEGNFDLDPMFNDAAARDFSLAPGSPCIDGGAPLPGYWGYEFDITGKPRPLGGAYDVGAYEVGDAYDDDGDGYWLDFNDCDDTNPNIYKGATEIPYNGVDENCNGMYDDDDLDRDGRGIAEDCDETDRTIYNGAPEIYGDGIDQDCDGADDVITTPIDDIPHDSHNIGSASCTKAITYGHVVAIGVDEWEQTADLNGDGDERDWVLGLYDIDTETMNNTQISIDMLLGFDGDYVVYRSEETGLMSVYDVAKDKSFDTTIDVYGHNPEKIVSNGRVVFDQRVNDLTGDGNPDNEVCVYDIAKDDTKCLGVYSTNATIDGDLVAYELGGYASMIGVYDLATDTAVVLSSISGWRPIVSEGVIAFEGASGYYWERELEYYVLATGDHGGTDIRVVYDWGFHSGIITALVDEGDYWGDLNGDGDDRDFYPVIYFTIATGRITNTGVLGCCGGHSHAGVIAFDAYEGNRNIMTDLNGDGDMDDCVQQYVLINTLDVVLAEYNDTRETLTFRATTLHGEGANLEVVGYGPMDWNRSEGVWELELRRQDVVYEVTITGREGSVTVPVTVVE